MTDPPKTSQHQDTGPPLSVAPVTPLQSSLATLTQRLAQHPASSEAETRRQLQRSNAQFVAAKLHAATQVDLETARPARVFVAWRITRALGLLNATLGPLAPITDLTPGDAHSTPWETPTPPPDQLPRVLPQGFRRHLSAFMDSDKPLSLGPPADHYGAAAFRTWNHAAHQVAQLLRLEAPVEHLQCEQPWLGHLGMRMFHDVPTLRTVYPTLDQIEELERDLAVEALGLVIRGSAVTATNTLAIRYGFKDYECGILLALSRRRAASLNSSADRAANRAIAEERMMDLATRAKQDDHKKVEVAALVEVAKLQGLHKEDERSSFEQDFEAAIRNLAQPSADRVKIRAPRELEAQNEPDLIEVTPEPDKGE